MLDRCKGNNTQNNNESYNGLLWHFSTKHLHNGFKTIELSNNFATATITIFNDRYSSILKIFNVMEVIVGPAKEILQLLRTTREYESLIIAKGLLQKKVDHLEEQLLQPN